MFKFTKEFIFFKYKSTPSSLSPVIIIIPFIFVKKKAVAILK